MYYRKSGDNEGHQTVGEVTWLLPDASEEAGVDDESNYDPIHFIHDGSLTDV